MSKLLDFTNPIKCSHAEGQRNPTLRHAAIDDSYKFKAKVVNAGKPNARVEIRKAYDGANIMIFVAKDGWDYSKARESRTPDRWGRSTLGKNVRFSMNGSIHLTFDDFSDIHAAVAGAAAVLGA